MVPSCGRRVLSAAGHSALNHMTDKRCLARRDVLQGLLEPDEGPFVAMQFLGLLDDGSVTEGVFELREKASHGSPFFFGFVFASRGTVAGAVHDAEEGSPRADGVPERCVCGA